MARAQHGSPVDTRNLPPQVLGACRTLELAARSPEEFWEQQFTVTCHVGAHHSEKVLREASSRWAQLVAVCYQNWALGELQDKGNRQRKCLPPPESLRHPLLPQARQSHRWNIYPAHLHYHCTGKEGQMWT